MSIMSDYLQANRRLERQARQERERIAGEVTVQRGKVEGQRATLRNELNTILGKLKATKTMELRKRDLPITKPSKPLLAHIKASREDVTAQVAKHEAELDKLLAELKTAEAGALADLESQVNAEQRKINKWKREADKEYKEYQTAIKATIKPTTTGHKLDTNEWISNADWTKMDKNARDYANKYGVKWYNKYYIPAQTWLRGAQLAKGAVILKTPEQLAVSLSKKYDMSYAAVLQSVKAHTAEYNFKQLIKLGIVPERSRFISYDPKTKEYTYQPSTFGTKPYLAQPPKAKTTPATTRIAGISVPKELAWAGFALPIVTATPVPFDDAIFWAALGLGAAYIAVRGAVAADWRPTFRLESGKLSDIIEGIPDERMRLQDIIEGMPLGKITMKDITESFPFTRGKITDITTKFPLTQTQLKDITEQIPIIKQTLEETMTVAVASATAGRDVVKASGGFISSPKVSGALTDWQTSLGTGVIRDIQEAMNNADRAVDTEYSRQVLTLKGQQGTMTKAEYARQFNALTQAHIVWDRSIKVYNAKLKDFAVATEELVSSIAPEYVNYEGLTTKQKLAVSGYVASLLSKLYDFPKPVKEMTAIQIITQNIVVPQTVAEVVSTIAAQSVIQARTEGLTKPKTIAQAVPATQAGVKAMAIPSTVMPASRVTALVRPAVLEAVATPTTTLTRTLTLPVPIPFKIRLPSGKTLTLTKKQYEGIIAWKQGFMYKMIYPPYGDKQIVNSRKPLAGVKYYSGPGSAYKSIIAKGGIVPRVIVRDMGIMDIRIVTPKGSRKPKIRYKRDIKQRTRTTPGLSQMR